MSSQKSSTEQRKLIDNLAADPLHGRLLGILATTYEMQPEFFETDFLPTLLGLGAWDDRNWTSRIALEKHLAELESATLLMDARPYRGRPRSLRVEVQPVSLRQGQILHAKVLISVYEKSIRLIVGSANLTEPGYRKNREIVAVLTAGPQRAVEAGLISAAILGMENLLAPWMTESSRELSELAKRRLAEWRGTDASKEQWFVWGGAEIPLWQQVLDRWPKDERVKCISVVSPFWSEERIGGPEQTFLKALKNKGCLSSNAKLNLYAEAAPDQQNTYKPKLPESFCDFDSLDMDIQAFALAVNPCVPPEEVNLGQDFVGTRALHAKVMLLEGENTSLAYFGSANFTRRGWGFLNPPQRANIEAGIVVRRNGNQQSALTSLLPPTTGEPVPLTKAAVGKLALPDPSPDELPWPSFLREILLSPSQADSEILDLKVEVDPEILEGAWTVSFLPNEDFPQQILLEATPEPKAQTEYRIPLDKTSLSRLLREQEVWIRWWACPEGRSFPINVAASARSELPISPESGRPAEQHLIAYYQGRITWEDLFPDPENPPFTPHDKPEPDDVSGVDTSRIQSYIVREFVEALKGINDDLKAAAQSTKACMRLALLGTVSPVALARRILEAAKSGERSPTATGFQLVEILACLHTARNQNISPLFQADWLALLDEAVTKVTGYLNELQSRFPTELTNDFRHYAETVGQLHLMDDNT